MPKKLVPYISKVEKCYVLSQKQPSAYVEDNRNQRRIIRRTIFWNSGKQIGYESSATAIETWIAVSATQWMTKNFGLNLKKIYF